MAQQMMHRSKDNKWRECHASRRGCPINGGHVSENDLHRAAQVSKGIGFDVSKLNANEVKALAEKQHERDMKTPAYLLGDRKREQLVPPLGIIKELPPQKHLYVSPESRYSALATVINNPANHLSGIAETQKETLERSGTSVMDHNSTVEYAITYEDEATDETNTIKVTEKVKAGSSLSSPANIVSRLIKEAAYYDSATKEDWPKPDEETGEYPVSELGKLRKITAGENARDDLDNLFGNQTAKKIIDDYNTVKDAPKH